MSAALSEDKISEPRRSDKSGDSPLAVRPLNYLESVPKAISQGLCRDPLSKTLSKSQQSEPIRSTKIADKVSDKGPIPHFWDKLYLAWFRTAQRHCQTNDGGDHPANEHPDGFVGG